MQQLSESRKTQLKQAAVKYRNALPGSPAAEYLAYRLKTTEGPVEFGLGYVDDPEPNHVKYRGMLAIPYIRYSPKDGSVSVVSMRFRCVTPECKHEGHPKYAGESGDVGRMYNTKAISDNQEWVGICEGELDAITATLCDVPTVGIPGATHWKPEWAVPFYGFDTVFVFTDGDEAGKQFGDTVANSLPNAKVVPCGPGEDINAEYLLHGADAIKRKVK